MDSYSRCGTNANLFVTIHHGGYECNTGFILEKPSAGDTSGDKTNLSECKDLPISNDKVKAQVWCSGECSDDWCIDMIRIKTSTGIEYACADEDSNWKEYYSDLLDCI